MWRKEEGEEKGRQKTKESICDSEIQYQFSQYYTLVDTLIFWSAQWPWLQISTGNQRKKNAKITEIFVSKQSSY